MARETREIYRGNAIIMGISMMGVEDWREWEKRELSETDLTNAFKIVYDVAEGDAHGRRHDVEVEISHRQLKGKMLEFYKREDGKMPTQIDLAIRTLARQKIVTDEGDRTNMADAISEANLGRTVTIRAYEELGADGAKWWPRCVFASAKTRLSGGDMSARMTAFVTGKPAPTPTKAVATSSAMPPAPDDDSDMPF